MTRAQYWLQPFDRNRMFIVARCFLCRGETLKIGAGFDPTLCTERRLRQLYEMRYLRMADEAPQDARSPDPKNWWSLPWLELRKHVHVATGRWPASKAHAAELMRAING